MIKLGFFWGCFNPITVAHVKLIEELLKVKDLDNKGGRPELPDEQKSEKTQANIKAMN